MLVKEKMSVEAFAAFLATAEGDTGKRFELLDGEPVPMPTNTWASYIAMRLALLLGTFLQANRIDGYLVGADGGFVVNGQVFAPDVAYTRHLSKGGFAPEPPLLAVEVLSDPFSNKEQRDLRRKLAHYMAAGVVVWVVDYEAKTIDVHAPNQPVAGYGMGDTLTGGHVLPDFTLAVSDVFADIPSDPA